MATVETNETFDRGTPEITGTDSTAFGSWIKVETRQVHLAPQEDLEVHYVGFPDIAVVIGRVDDSIVLIRQFRYAMHGWIVEAPAGRVEPTRTRWTPPGANFRKRPVSPATTMTKLGELRVSPAPVQRNDARLSGPGIAPGPVAYDDRRADRGHGSTRGGCPRHGPPATHCGFQDDLGPRPGRTDVAVDCGACMFLSDHDIKQAIDEGEISIEPFDRRLLKRNSYLLRLAPPPPPDRPRVRRRHGHAAHYDLAQGVPDTAESFVVDHDSLVLGCSLEQISVLPVDHRGAVRHLQRGPPRRAPAQHVGDRERRLRPGQPVPLVFEMATIGGMRVRLYAGTPVCHLLFRPTPVADPATRSTANAPDRTGRIRAACWPSSVTSSPRVRPSHTADRGGCRRPGINAGAALYAAETGS